MSNPNTPARCLAASIATVLALAGCGRQAAPAAGEIRGVLKRMFDYGLTAGLVKVNPVLAQGCVIQRSKLLM